MEIKRRALEQLAEWKIKSSRKPLLLTGIRQVGKTWLLKHFGKKYFDDTAYFNFERQEELGQFFRTTRDPRRIIDNLSLVHGRAIQPQNTLIIFDEIQESGEALNSLKYFCEEASEYAVACAGSLLGVALGHDKSFPVGKVNFLQVYPVTFSEFLSEEAPDLYGYLEQIDKPEPIPEIFFNPLCEKLKMYFISGGMPEAVATLLGARDTNATQAVLQSIISSYQLDFSKHVEKKDIPKINYIWNSLPSQLARENKKFLYQTVRPGARAREYEDALLWLSNAGLVTKVYCSEKPGIPLTAYDDLTAFKVYLPDVGVLRRLSLLDPVAFSEGNRMFTEFKGALTENYILSGLTGQFEPIPRYWRSGNKAEVDFLIQYRNQVIPVEVKSDENIRSKSLAYYKKEYAPGLSVRFSLRNLKKDEGLINIPLFMVDYARKIIDKAFDKG
ncbi:MAG: ATP-binding protein [Bacteroidales bacterium]|nr:ATP-binding protein [Bacteroidales bacterium]